MKNSTGETRNLVNRAKRVVLAGLFHETHSFIEGTTSLEDFQIAFDEELLKRTGDSSPLGGVLESANDFGWEIVPTVDFRATPSGTVEDTVIERFWSELARRLDQPFDAIYLVLHGAMVAHGMSDVEGEILERLRKKVGPSIPIFGVFDLHANFSERMAVHANGLVAYRENPHSDARHAAQIAADLLQRTFTTGHVPRMHLAHPSLMWPPTGTATASEPMRALEERARQMEQRSPDLWAINVGGGFAYADTFDTGVSFTTVAIGDETESRDALAELSAMAIATRALGNTIDPPVDNVLDQLHGKNEGLTVLVEPSDNIGGGAPGDGTGLLRGLLRHRLPNSAIAINDPLAVQQLSDMTCGMRQTVSIGGKSNRLDAGPVVLEVEVLRVGTGRFELEDKQSHLASMCGDSFDMGPCAVVRHAGLTILLTSIKTPPFDLGQWRSQGLEPTQFSFIGVKAAVAHRRAYDPIASRMFWVDTPGPCTSNLRMFPYQKIRRPIYPLDP